MYRAMSRARKLQLAMQFNAAARRLKAQVLKAQHPDWSAEQIQSRVKELFLYAGS